MVLGIDADRAAGARLGVGRNLEYLLRAWSQRDQPFDEVRVFARAPIVGLPESERFRIEVIPGRGPGILWQTAHLRPRASNVDVFFAFYTLPPGHRGRSVVANLGIYEGEFAFPGWHARAQSWRYAYSARHADAVIANARSTKADLANFYGIPTEKITVIWPGADRRFRPARPDEQEAIEVTVENMIGERAPYFLFVGKLSARRNVPAVLEAFAEVHRRLPRFRLLLVGPNTANLDLATLLERYELANAAHHIEHLDQEALAILYRGARAFVMPTTREGFSHPILEAMGSGCPVLALKGASVGALEYVDEAIEGGAASVVLEVPGPEPQNLAQGLTRLATDDELYGQLREAGLRAAAAFPSWDEHADSVMGVLAGVANGAG